MMKFEELSKTIQDKIYNVYKRYKRYYDSWDSATDEAVEYEALHMFVKAEDELVELLNKYLGENKEALFEFNDVKKALQNRWLRDTDYWKLTDIEWGR